MLGVCPEDVSKGLWFLGHPGRCRGTSQANCAGSCGLLEGGLLSPSRARFGHRALQFHGLGFDSLVTPSEPWLPPGHCMQRGWRRNPLTQAGNLTLSQGPPHTSLPSPATRGRLSSGPFRCPHSNEPGTGTFQSKMDFTDVTESSILNW